MAVVFFPGRIISYVRSSDSTVNKNRRTHLYFCGLPWRLKLDNRVWPTIDNLVVFVLLWQVSREDLPCVLSQELLEDGREGDHWFSGAQLGALHHALLVIDEEVSTAGQYRPALLRARLGWALCSEVCHETVYQLAQVPAGARKMYMLDPNWLPREKHSYMFVLGDRFTSNR